MDRKLELPELIFKFKNDNIVLLYTAEDTETGETLAICSMDRRSGINIIPIDEYKNIARTEDIYSNCEPTNVAPCYYRHFKGKWYSVLQVVRNKKSSVDYVIYKAMYGNKKIYARPLDMFLSLTDTKKHPKATQKYRFMSLNELKDVLGQDKVSKMFSDEVSDNSLNL